MSNARTDTFTPAELAAMAQDEQMRPIVIAHVEHYGERITLAADQHARVAADGLLAWDMLTGWAGAR